MRPEFVIAVGWASFAVSLILPSVHFVYHEGLSPERSPGIARAVLSLISPIVAPTLWLKCLGWLAGSANLMLVAYSANKIPRYRYLAFAGVGVSSLLIALNEIRPLAGFYFWIVGSVLILLGTHSRTSKIG